MRYAFVFLSIVSIWVAAILLAMNTHVDGIFLVSIVVGMTIALYLIGFHRGR